MDKGLKVSTSTRVPNEATDYDDHNMSVSMTAYQHYMRKKRNMSTLAPPL